MNRKKQITRLFLIILVLALAQSAGATWNFEVGYTKIEFGNGPYLTVSTSSLPCDSIWYGDSRITFVTEAVGDVDIYLTTTVDLTLTDFPNGTNYWMNLTLSSSGTQTIYYGYPSQVLLDSVVKTEGDGWTYNDHLITVTGATSSIAIEYTPGSYLFYGVYNEDTGERKPSVDCIVTVHYEDATLPDSFTLNGSYAYSAPSTPLYFHYNFSVVDRPDRQYWLDPQETSGTFYVFDTNTTIYTFQFLDLAGVLDDHPYIEIKRIVNGTLFIVEKRKVDAEKKIVAALKNGEKYTIVITDSGSYTYGELQMTDELLITLTLKGIEFPQDIILAYRYVRLYAYRHNNFSSITCMYEDTQTNTDYTNVTVYHENGTQMYTTSPTADSFNVTWTSAEYNVTYYVHMDAHHATYGELNYRVTLPGGGLTTPPFGLDFLGSFPSGMLTSTLIPMMFIFAGALVFSKLNAFVGAFVATGIATLLHMWGWIQLSIPMLVMAWAFTFLLALAYARRKVFVQ